MSHFPTNPYESQLGLNPLALKKGVFVDESSSKLTGNWVKSVDSSIAEVTDKQPMAEHAEICRRHCDAPGSVKIKPVRKTSHHMPSSIENGYIAQPRTVVFIR